MNELRYQGCDMVEIRGGMDVLGIARRDSIFADNIHSTTLAEQRPGADCLQRPLRSRFRPQLRPGVSHLSNITIGGSYMNEVDGLAVLRFEMVEEIPAFILKELVALVDDTYFMHLYLNRAEEAQGVFPEEYGPTP
jgi:hypothetical protein